MNSVRSYSLRLKYQWFTHSGCKYIIGIRQFERVAKIELLSRKFETVMFSIITLLKCRSEKQKWSTGLQKSISELER